VGELQRIFPGIPFVAGTDAQAARDALRDQKSATIATLHWDVYYDTETESNVGQSHIADAVQQFKELMIGRYQTAGYVPNDAPVARGYVEVAEHWSSVTLCVIEKCA
jgi:hypothetical protein